MTTYQSDIKTISSSRELVFDMLANLNNLDKIKNHPAISGKLNVLACDTNSCLLDLPEIGKVGLNIVERSHVESIKFSASHLPMEVFAWIHLEELTNTNTNMRLILQANIPGVLKIMLNKKLTTGINKLADFFADFLQVQLLNNP